MKTAEDIRKQQAETRAAMSKRLKGRVDEVVKQILEAVERAQSDPFRTSVTEKVAAGIGDESVLLVVREDVCSRMRALGYSLYVTRTWEADITYTVSWQSTARYVTLVVDRTAGEEESVVCLQMEQSDNILNVAARDGIDAGSILAAFEGSLIPSLVVRGSELVRYGGDAS